MNFNSEFPDGPVFHYTSQKGLLGIVSSKSIWATNILYTNDAAELQLAVQLANLQLANLLESASGKDHSLLERVKFELNRITSMRLDGTYVCSFSSRGDQLSQWSGYCPDECGLSIGIDLVRLQEAIAVQGFRIAKCVYESYHQSQVIRAFLDESLNDLRRLFPTGYVDDDVLQVPVAVVVQKFLQIALTIKHEKFSEEDEWPLTSRPISFGDPRLKFREGKSTIVPCVEFKLANKKHSLNVDKLCIGPTPHRELAFTATIQLLSANGVGGFSPEISEVPYRTW